MADHATYLLKPGAHYSVYVKGNRAALYEQLSQLPWKQVPVTHVQGPEHAYGRQERRTVQVVAVNGLAFPGALQAVRIRRSP